MFFEDNDTESPAEEVFLLNIYFAPSMTVQAGLCLIWSETQIVGFVTHRLKYNYYQASHTFRHDQSVYRLWSEEV